MRFWDASAIIPLLVTEPASDDLLHQLSIDRDMAVWWATSAECISAMRRQVREKVINHAGESHARDLLAILKHRWREIEPSLSLRPTAEQLLGAYPLRAADALQLAAALAWNDAHFAGQIFVCLDRRLREAAAREGFVLLPPTLTPSLKQ